jgi:hypothetical protein
VKVLWDANNTAHIAKHGIAPDLAEKIFEAGLKDIRTTDLNSRYVIEAEIDDKKYRLVCDIAKNGRVYPVTAFPIRKIKETV